MTQEHRGGCRCGAVRYRCTGEPEFVANCRCEDCRRSTGAAFSTWVAWADSQVEIVAGTPAVHASSEGVQRGFCRTCGTPSPISGRNGPERPIS